MRISFRPSAFSLLTAWMYLQRTKEDMAFMTVIKTGISADSMQVERVGVKTGFSTDHNMIKSDDHNN